MFGSISNKLKHPEQTEQAPALKRDLQPLYVREEWGFSLLQSVTSPLDFTNCHALNFLNNKTTIVQIIKVFLCNLKISQAG